MAFQCSNQWTSWSATNRWSLAKSAICSVIHSLQPYSKSRLVYCSVAKQRLPGGLVRSHGLAHRNFCVFLFCSTKIILCRDFWIRNRSPIATHLVFLVGGCPSKRIRPRRFNSWARPRGAQLLAWYNSLGACGDSILAPRRIFWYQRRSIP